MTYEYNYFFRPRHADFDEYKIAHHSKFLCWFEEARYECFEQFGDVFTEIGNLYKMPVTRLETKFYNPVSNTNILCARVSIDFPQNLPILKIKYRLMDKNKKCLYAKGVTEHVFADEELRILKETPEAFNKIITSIMENQYEK